VKAISRPTRSDLAPIRVKEPVRFEQVETIFPRFVLIVHVLYKIKEVQLNGAYSMVLISISEALTARHQLL